jgi:predicted membrane channel-forming protein YqfA (hemolysin III family)
MNATPEQRMARRLRVSGVLIILGLLVEALSLIRIHPLSFLAFMFIGGGLLIAGVVIYLYSLIAVAHPSPPRDLS